MEQRYVKPSALRSTACERSFTYINLYFLLQVPTAGFLAVLILSTHLTKNPKSRPLRRQSQLSSTPLSHNNQAMANLNPSSLAKGLLTFVGLSRALFGVGCVVSPALGMKFLGLSNMSTDAAILCRMFGVREIIVGGFLVLAERGRQAIARRGSTVAQQSAAADEVRRAIWWNVATDGLDAVAIVISFGQDSLDGPVFAKMVTTALVYFAAGLQTAWLYS